MSTADVPVQKQREEQGSKSTEQTYHHTKLDKSNQFAGIAGQKVTSEPLARSLVNIQLTTIKSSDSEGELLHLVK